MGAVTVTLKWSAVALLASMATTAAAQDAPGVRFCPNRPSLGASGCTTLPGQVQVELAGVDWQRDDDGETREDLIRSEVTARIGLTQNSEAQIAWTSLGTLRTRDRTTGETTRVTGAGDVTLGWRRALSHPDGKKLSAAVQPYVTLPVGHSEIGAGDWSAGAVLPVMWRIDKKWSVDFTGQLAAAVDEDGAGRHFDATGVFGVGYALTDSVSANAEFSVERDQDPTEHVVRTLAAASLAWKPTKHTQFDLLAVAGLNHHAPDARVALGGALLF